MPIDHSELQQHVERLLKAIEDQLDGADGQLGNFCTVVEVLSPVEGKPAAFNMSLRTRYKGGPTAALGLLRIAEANMVNGVLQGAEADTESEAQD